MTDAFLKQLCCSDIMADEQMIPFDTCEGVFADFFCFCEIIMDSDHGKGS